MIFISLDVSTGAARSVAAASTTRTACRRLVRGRQMTSGKSTNLFSGSYSSTQVFFKHPPGFRVDPSKPPKLQNPQARSRAAVAKIAYFPKSRNSLISLENMHRVASKSPAWPTCLFIRPDSIREDLLRRPTATTMTSANARVSQRQRHHHCQAPLMAACNAIDEGGPVSKRRIGLQPGTTASPATQTGHLGRRAGFVEEHQPMDPRAHALPERDASEIS